MRRVEAQPPFLEETGQVQEAYEGVNLDEIDNFRKMAIRFVSNEDPTDEQVGQINKLERTEGDLITIRHEGYIAGDIWIARSTRPRLGSFSEIFAKDENVFTFRATGPVDNMKVEISRGTITNSLPQTAA